jgi:phosphate transport system substrate-binding protein
MRADLFKWGLAVVVAGLAGPAARAEARVDPLLPEHKAAAGVAGTVKSVGSDTMNNLMTLWGEGFKKLYPGVTFEIEGKGSGTAPPALINGAASFGPMSREMKGTEIDQFETKYGYKPTALPAGIDMLAVYVHKDNPIEGLTLRQVDAIFSRTRRGGAAQEARTWGDLGLGGEWADKPISLYGRNSASGTYAFFKEHALSGGDYKNTVKEQPGSSAVVQGVASDRYAIGYSGIGYKTADVRAVPLKRDAGARTFIEATEANAYSGEYPMSRFLYLYVNFDPARELDPLRREFVRYVYSKQGQTAVVKDGYFPVSAAVAKKALASVGIK